jgi:hypothetical protein
MARRRGIEMRERRFLPHYELGRGITFAADKSIGATNEPRTM